MTTATKKAPVKATVPGAKSTSTQRSPAARKADASRGATASPSTDAPAAGPVTAQATAKPERAAKAKKPKLVRDSFTIPKVEYLVLDELKLRSHKLTHPAKKTELLRAGIKALAAMSDGAFLAALKSVPAIKTGRPAKDGAPPPAQAAH